MSNKLELFITYNYWQNHTYLVSFHNTFCNNVVLNTHKNWAVSQWCRVIAQVVLFISMGSALGRKTKTFLETWEVWGVGELLVVTTMKSDSRQKAMIYDYHFYLYHLIKMLFFFHLLAGNTDDATANDLNHNSSQTVKILAVPFMVVSVNC